MHTEIQHAARYWRSCLDSGLLDAEQLHVFEVELVAALIERYSHHWYDENPIKGQAYRSILVDFEHMLVDDALVHAATRADIDALVMRLASSTAGGSGVRMWVDPGEVTVDVLRGRHTEELVVFKKPTSPMLSAVATSAPTAATSISSRLSASAAPFRSSRGLYTAADHELYQQQNQQHQQQQQQHQQQHQHQRHHSRAFYPPQSQQSFGFYPYSAYQQQQPQQPYAHQHLAAF